ncbi:MAG: carboxypeptidase-like regulatory domain-containing protein [Ktedonobacteraceae bacterium]
MIKQADREVQAWIQEVVADAEVILGPPRQLDGKHGVSLYLLALADPLPAWANWQAAQRIALRYLITTWATEEEEAHILLEKLVFAAMEKREYELSLTELPVALWTALGIAPRPGLTLWVPCSLAQPEQAIKLVRGPLVMHGAPVRSLHGIVLGPGDVPIVGAGVELPALQLRGHTDTRGRFHFATVPGTAQPFQLIVKAKGRRQSVIVEQSTSDKEPLTIRFDSFDAR